MERRVLITGGAGFVGSALARALTVRGDRVHVFDDLTTGKMERLVDIPHDFTHASITDVDALQRAVAGADAVVHLAAVVSVPECTTNPARAEAVNTVGTANVVAAAEAAGCTRLVYASSAAVFGNVTELPVTETSPTDPLSPYGATKLAGEHAVVASRVPNVSLRYMNIVGPGQDPSSPYAAVVPIFASRMRAGEPITIFGDGSQTRDFIALDDIIAANIAALDANITCNEVCVIGTGVESSLMQLVAALEDVMGVRARVQYAPARDGDIARSYCDPSHAARVLNWKPQLSLRDALVRAVAK